MDLRFPSAIANFFGVDVRQDIWLEVQREGTKLFKHVFLADKAVLVFLMPPPPSKHVQRATIGPPVKRLLNGVLLAG